MTVVNRYIGAPIERVEDLRFLRGHRSGIRGTAPISAAVITACTPQMAHDWQLLDVERNIGPGPLCAVNTWPTSCARGCCMRPSCAARSRTAASAH